MSSCYRFCCCTLVKNSCRDISDHITCYSRTCNCCFFKTVCACLQFICLSDLSRKRTMDPLIWFDWSFIQNMMPLFLQHAGTSSNGGSVKFMLIDQDASTGTRLCTPTTDDSYLCLVCQITRPEKDIHFLSRLHSLCVEKWWEAVTRLAKQNNVNERWQVCMFVEEKLTDYKLVFRAKCDDYDWSYRWPLASASYDDHVVIPGVGEDNDNRNMIAKLPGVLPQGFVLLGTCCKLLDDESKTEVCIIHNKSETTWACMENNHQKHVLINRHVVTASTEPVIICFDAKALAAHTLLFEPWSDACYLRVENERPLELWCGPFFVTYLAPMALLDPAYEAQVLQHATPQLTQTPKKRKK
jgi:hypothetical protein